MARLRARGELVEIRAEDLRFTADEASTYLNEVMGLGLGPEHVAALEERTEGWIAALQLAALSMEGRDDVADFIARFTGNDRYIVDYLVEEVLTRLPDEIRISSFDTSILDQLNGPLCDAVPGCAVARRCWSGLSGEPLRRPTRRPASVVPLSPPLRRCPAGPPRRGAARSRSRDLHRRASEWYGQQGERTEAIRHALAADDFERTAELIESRSRRCALRGTRRSSGVGGGAPRRAGPSSSGPQPCLRRGIALDSVSWRESRAAWTTPSDGSDGSPDPGVWIAFVDEGELRRLRGDIEVHRAALAQVRGDVLATVEHAQRAMELALEDDHVVRAGAAGFLGIALWTGGDLEAAHRAWSECVASSNRRGTSPTHLGPPRPWVTSA